MQGVIYFEVEILVGLLLTPMITEDQKTEILKAARFANTFPARASWIVWIIDDHLSLISVSVLAAEKVEAQTLSTQYKFPLPETPHTRQSRALVEDHRTSVRGTTPYSINIRVLVRIE
jgi:hypothetical protein